jgi:signal transduction histidine kinase/FixJ family two-component response regulator
MQSLSLTRRIALAAALLTLLTVSLIGGVAFLILRGQAMDTMQHSLEHSAEDVARLMENRLDNLAETLTTLAANPLIANALVDNEGRKQYLSVFLESYETIANLPVSLTLTDYLGRPLSTSENGHFHFEPHWVAERVGANEKAATLIGSGNEQWLIMAQPVIYANTGLPEGALVLQFQLRHLMEISRSTSHLDDWRHSAHFALYVGNPIPQNTVFRLGNPEPENGIANRQPLQLPPELSPLHSELEVIIDPYHFNAPVRQLVYTSSALVVMVLIVISFISLMLGRTLTRRLRELEEAAHRFTLENFEPQRLPVTGSDEVTSLANSFNYLLDNLQEAFDELQYKSGSLELALEQAREARNEAESANQAKSIFLANMSHELRTPLNAILGFAQLLIRDPSLDKSHHQPLSTIYRSGRHLLSLINDVLEISRIEARHMELVEAPFDLHEMLLAVTDVLRMRADEKGIELRLILSPEVPGYITADERKLRQILLNLLGNALKFTDQGWVRLNVSVEGKYLRFDISDSGQGIPSDELPHIFEPFHQAEGDHRNEGTGLGLSISHEFITIMGGTIHVSSTLGKGSSFRIKLPYRNAKPGILTSSTKDNQRVVALLPGQPNYRVLVVDDKPDGREVLANLLDSVGFQVRTAENGAEAVEVFHDWRPHLILMDMRMPIMDGFEASRRIKATTLGKETPIIAITASAFEKDRAKVLEAGCDYFMRKPVNTDEVFDVMAHMLGVGYRYSHTPEHEHPAEPMKIFDITAAMAALPENLCADLAQAAASLDAEAARGIITAITEIDRTLAERLSTLADEYHYDELARLCGHNYSQDDARNQ